MHPKIEKFLKGILMAIIVLLTVVFGILLFERTHPQSGSDHANCIMNIRNFQTGARSRTALIPEQAPRDAAVDMTEVYSFMGIAAYTCPSGGTYTVHGRYDDPPGTVFLRCSHPDHAPTPAQSANW